MAEIPFEIKFLRYEKYLQPLINTSSRLTSMQTSWFCNKAFSLRTLNANPTDFDKILFIQEVCFELYNDPANKPNIIACLRTYFDEYALEIERITSVDQIRSRGLEKTKYVQELNDYYKTSFETGFRLFFSIPYLYILLNYPITSKQIAPEDVVRISASEKYGILSQMDKMLCRKQNFFEYITGYDNTLRNQGGGHERYYVDDNDNIVYSKIDDKTGKAKQMTPLPIVELEGILRTIERNLLLIDIGIALFVTNSGIDISGTRNRDFLQREIADRVAKYCENLLLDSLLEFNDSNKISIKLTHKPRMLGDGGQLIMGNGKAYDMIPQSENVTRKEQILGVMQTIGGFYPPGEMPDVHVDVFDENDAKLSELGIVGSEISKILKDSKNKEERYEPVLAYGTYPSGGYKLEYNVRVPVDLFESPEDLDAAIRYVKENIKNKGYDN